MACPYCRSRRAHAPQKQSHGHECPPPPIGGDALSRFAPCASSALPLIMDAACRGVHVPAQQIATLTRAVLACSVGYLLTHLIAVH